jgi:NAD-dependent deacetylase
MFETELGDLAARLRSARAVAALTGAGISAESGVPTFRGHDGLWRNFSATDLATPEAFDRDPALVWEWYRWRRGLIGRAQPNAGHLALARMEAALPGFDLVTQNVDGLHRRAGSRRIVELHGNIWRARCSRDCGFVIDQSEEASAEQGDGRASRVPTCRCGARLRPDVVWFGEALDPADVDRAVEAARQCDVFLVIGTSALVYPAAGLPSVASRAGALVVEVNVDDTPLTPLAGAVLRGPAAVVLPALEARL